MSATHAKSHGDKMERIGAILGVVLLLIVLIYTYFNRTVQEWFNYAVYIGLFVFVIITTIIIYNIIQHGFSKSSWKTIGLFLSLPLLSLTGGFSYYAFGVGIKDLFLWLISTSHTISGSIVYTILLCLAIGIILFFFRLKRRVIYGFVETVTGLIVAGHRVYSNFEIDIQNPDFYLAILTAGIFLVVRGIDNMHQGWITNPKDPWAVKIYSKFFRKERI